MPFKKAFFSFLLTFTCSCFWAQQLRFSHITLEQGLSQAIVNCVLSDEKGFMWFGTQDGLNRYDGYEIKVYKNNPEDSNSISNNYITALYEDNTGNLWVGTYGGGIDVLNLTTNKIAHFKSEKLLNNKIKTIFGDSKGDIWIGTDDGIGVFDKTKKEFIHYNFQIPQGAEPQSKSVWAITEDDKGILWFTSYGNYLYSFDKKEKKFSSFPVTIPDQYASCKSMRSICKLKNGKFLLGSEAGMFEFDPIKREYIRSFLFEKQTNDINSNRISSIIEDEENIWVGTINGGFHKMDLISGNITSYLMNPNVAFSINNNFIRCLYKDKQGTIWIGTDGGGVNVLFKSANKFTHYKTAGEIPLNIYSMLVDKQGLLWIGTADNGVISYDFVSKEYSFYPQLTSVKNNGVLSLFEDNEGLIWVGTWGDGLNCYNKNNKIAKKYPVNQNGLQDGNVIALAQDSDHNIWVGTFGGGVYLFDREKELFINYSIKDGLSSNYIYCLFIDADDKVWIGTDAGGVNILDIKKGGNIQKFQNNKQKNSISSNTINCIVKDQQGNIWIGTSNGLNKFNRENNTFEKFYEKDGLPNDYIYGVLEDSNKNLWLSTNKGISRFNPGVVNKDGSAFRNFGVSDGLQGHEFNQGAFCKGESGELFFGGTNGFNFFKPSEIKSNSHAPDVYITDVKKFGKTFLYDTLVYEKQNIELSYKDNFISFEFVALDYQMPSQNKYSFMLEGVDEDWSEPGNMRFASYTQLEPGEYTFKVKAANSDGVWNEEGASIRIKIVPPFWKTKWFYSLCILSFIAAVLGFIRWRTASIKKEKRILEIKVEERTKELAEKNRDITSSIQYAKRIQEAILPPIETIYNHFPDSFLLYKPKDIVSGDFYWFAEKNGKKIIAVVDCTGHGVPGAFMSMIGHNLLNQIVVENGIIDPASILNELHKGVQAALKQGSNVIDTSDGMDVALCCFDEKLSQVTFAGAFRPLFIVNGDNIEKIAGNKFPIGGAQLDLSRQFTNNTRFLKKGDKLYMFSDGYADQFGGEKGKKFMLKRFSDILISFHHTKMKEQHNSLKESIESWSKGFEQVDDILVIGIAV